jgi:hypothetical protein
MKGDDGLRTANHLEEKLLTQYRTLNEHDQRSARKLVHQMVRYAKPAEAPKPKRRSAKVSDVMRTWAREAGRRARGGE